MLYGIAVPNAMQNVWKMKRSGLAVQPQPCDSHKSQGFSIELRRLENFQNAIGPAVETRSSTSQNNWCWKAGLLLSAVIEDFGDGERQAKLSKLGMMA